MQSFFILSEFNALSRILTTFIHPKSVELRAREGPEVARLSDPNARIIPKPTHDVKDRERTERTERTERWCSYGRAPKLPKLPSCQTVP